MPKVVIIVASSKHIITEGFDDFDYDWTIEERPEGFPSWEAAEAYARRMNEGLINPSEADLYKPVEVTRPEEDDEYLSDEERYDQKFNEEWNHLYW